MKKILGLIVFLLFLGVYSVRDYASVKPLQSTYSFSGVEAFNVFEFDFSDYAPTEARVRASQSSSQRIKNERGEDISPVQGLLFLTCRIAKSYSEIYLHRYFRLFIEFAIQVNAP
ncbi:hypothetical protein Aoki45_12820 [Algoriphagus sp. oki45]|uniref:hypothetical protein n=1 Tax=Algoriphagus sp. oki45 TaxID=3067294 RepID=UPI0027F64813|nr:hypothetical protein Aoki45_12820 [Algoriphagus sp. oki45]